MYCNKKINKNTPFNFLLISSILSDHETHTFTIAHIHLFFELALDCMPAFANANLKWTQ